MSLNPTEYEKFCAYNYFNQLRHSPHL